MTCLWFDEQAEEAVRYYTDIFPDSKIRKVAVYGDAASNASGRPRGSVMTVEFEIKGNRFLALNGGPQFTFTEAVSIMVLCDDQDEIDEYWNRLSAGGSTSQCGWLKDRYGLSWQIVPKDLGDMMTDDDPEKAERVAAALMQMTKIDVDALKHAASESHAGSR